jgi:hypothetical protein
MAEQDAQEAGFGVATADEPAASAPGDLKAGDNLRKRQEALLDEAVQETFPASDPVSVARVPQR